MSLWLIAGPYVCIWRSITLRKGALAVAGGARTLTFIPTRAETENPPLLTPGPYKQPPLPQILVIIQSSSFSIDLLGSCGSQRPTDAPTFPEGVLVQAGKGRWALTDGRFLLMWRPK